MAMTGTTRTIFDKGMLAPVEITGPRIGFGTSEREESLAWAEIEIYRLPDEGGYMVHRSGCSVIYHSKDTRCTTRERVPKGKPASADDLPDDAVPCDKCRPPEPEYLPEGDGVVRFEFPRHTFDECKTPDQVVERLTVIRHRDGTRSVQYSQPVLDAIEEAANNDRAFERFRPSVVMFGNE